MKQPAVYIMTNKRNGTLYTSVTSKPDQRIWQHQNATMPGFSTKYACKLLAWHELHPTMASAFLREKQIKSGSRKKKLAPIEGLIRIGTTYSHL